MPPTATALPVIDISRFRGPDREAFLAELRAAAHEVGFFYVVGHSVPAQLRRGMLETAREFFALPEPARLEIENVNSPQFRGYTRTGTEHTKGVPDWREQIDIGYLALLQMARVPHAGGPACRLLTVDCGCGPGVTTARLPGTATASRGVGGPDVVA